MTGAIRSWARADWRRNRWRLLGLALFAGLSCGVVVTALAGAQRTASSFDRLRSDVRAYDHGVVIDAPGNVPVDHFDAATVRRVRALPEVARSGEVVIYLAALKGSDSDISIYAPADGVVGHQIERDRLLRGRRPRDDRADEVTLNEAAVSGTGVDVGDVLTVGTLTPEQRLKIIAGDPHAFDDGPLGPTIDLHVVGVLRGPNDVVGRADPSVVATQAFDRTYRGKAAYTNRVLFVHRRAGTTAADFAAALQRATGGGLGDFDAADEDKAARQALHVLSSGLLAFGAFAAIAAALAVNQAVARHLDGSERDQPALMALGFTRAERARGVMATVAPAAVGGALVAVLGSTAASVIMPVGLAHLVEPDPGVQLLPHVAAGAAIAVLIVVGVAALLAALGITRTDQRSLTEARTSRVAATLGRAGAGPVVTTGARLAFDRRAPAPPVRSTLVGLVAVVIMLVGALTFSASLDRLERDPSRWGYGWDLMLDTSVESKATTPGELRSNPDISAVSLLSGGFTYAGDTGRFAYGLTPVKGEIEYDLRSGMQPVGADEVVVGPGTAKTLGVGVGDNLRVALCPCDVDPASLELAPVRVVGIALFPNDDGTTFTNALGFSGSGFTRHVGDQATPRVALQIADGRSLHEVARDLADRYPGQVSSYSYPARPGEVANLAEVRRFPRILAVLAATLGLTAMANALVATRRRRRSELATLRSIGLTPGQTGRCIVSQGMSIIVVALGFGIPMGFIAGASVWEAVTRDLGVATDAAHLWWPVALFAVATVLVTGAIGLQVGAGAARMSTSASLHAE